MCVHYTKVIDHSSKTQIPVIWGPRHSDKGWGRHSAGGKGAKKPRAQVSHIQRL